MIKIAEPFLPDKEKLKEIIDDIWDTKQISNYGKYLQLFEEKVREYTGCYYVLGVSNCDTALKLSLSTMGMCDHICIPTFTFNATLMAALWNGCGVKLLDINKKTLLVDLNVIEDNAKIGYKNFLLVNIFGNLYDIDSLNFLREKYGLKILFDSAHSFGSSYKCMKSGNLGYTECFSFSPTKLITSGEGGIICTDDKSIYDKLLYARNYGFYGDYNSKIIGSNGKLSELNAAVGYLSMDILDDLFVKKEKIVKIFHDKLGTEHFQIINLHVRTTNKDIIVLDLEDSEKTIKKMEDNDIQVKKYFLPLHMQDICTESTISLPNSEHVYENSICIPSHYNLKDEEVEKICDILEGEL
ncbi:MAG: DegT/DnrJ/EryC1/StrS family aminotransferase [Candidatus Hodarchaeales archaeon]|jgi:dTDP-4-amino-4,6-dideoxygalactose transaminase